MRVIANIKKGLKAVAKATKAGKHHHNNNNNNNNTYRCITIHHTFAYECSHTTHVHQYINTHIEQSNKRS
jgi:hypothetical protein